MHTITTITITTTSYRWCRVQFFSTRRSSNAYVWYLTTGGKKYCSVGPQRERQLWCMADEDQKGNKFVFVTIAIVRDRVLTLCHRCDCDHHSADYVVSEEYHHLLQKSSKLDEMQAECKDRQCVHVRALMTVHYQIQHALVCLYCNES
jgi:hypothetical protein